MQSPTSKTKNHSAEKAFVTAETICKLFEISERSLRRIKRSEFTEGVHYIQVNEKLLRYNLEVVTHWFQTRHNPVLHAAKCQEYLESLKVKKRSRTRKS